MLIYKSLREYEFLNDIHYNTAMQRKRSWRLEVVTFEWKDIWYIDRIETLKYLIKFL